MESLQPFSKVFQTLICNFRICSITIDSEKRCFKVQSYSSNFKRRNWSELIFPRLLPRRLRPSSVMLLPQLEKLISIDFNGLTLFRLSPRLLRPLSVISVQLKQIQPCKNAKVFDCSKLRLMDRKELSLFKPSPRMLSAWSVMLVKSLKLRLRACKEPSLLRFWANFFRLSSFTDLWLLWVLLERRKCKICLKVFLHFKLDLRSAYLLHLSYRIS